jgi:ribosomal protein L28
MAQTCAICKKGYSFAWRHIKLRGKYNPTIKKKKKPNLQWTKLVSGKRVKACTKCIKALSKRTAAKEKTKSPAVVATAKPEVLAETAKK